jgi:hypothetical protein
MVYREKKQNQHFCSQIGSIKNLPTLIGLQGQCYEFKKIDKKWRVLCQNIEVKSNNWFLR